MKINFKNWNAFVLGVVRDAKAFEFSSTIKYDLQR